MGTLGILIGAGSIGRKHLTELGKRVDRVIVVDPKRPEDLLPEQPRQVTVVGSLNELEEQLAQLSPSKIVCVVANWGPDHVGTILRLKEYGVRDYIVEKPISDSLEEIDSLQSLMEDQSISCRVNMNWSRSSLMSKIYKYSKSAKIGKPVRVVAELGAKGLSELGIHVIDFVVNLFESPPLRGSCFKSDSSINPRSKKLSYFDGTVVLDFGMRKHAIISFSNLSQVSGRISITFEFGTVELEMDGSLRGRVIHGRDNKHDVPITRTRSLGPYELIDSNVFEETASWNAVYRELISSAPSDYSGFTANRILLLALTREIFEFPLEANRLSSTEQRYKWKIT